MSTVLETDEWYWLEDKEQFAIPVKLLSIGGGSVKYELEDGTTSVLRVKPDFTMAPLNTECLNPAISNLIELKSLSENAVLHVLRKRFYNDDIYTLVSGILIACNPFKSMPIYDRETMDTYRRTKDHSALPPHIFSLANEAYVNMVHSGSPQSVIISGESGAGKTESIKLILKYLARLSEITSNTSKSVQDQILSANPVMEAFGNAKTSRNNNSSRFGKLITVNFSGGIIKQASIISYLLEKSRVVHQQAGERNYHVFYQLLAACTDDPKFGIANGLQDSSGRYHYLSDPESSYLYCVDELESFNEVAKSMEILGIDKAMQRRIFQVVACVLRMGDVQFNEAETADGHAIIDDVPEVERICAMLGLNEKEMKRCLVSRNFGVRSVVTCLFSVQQAKDTRDAFSKALYSYLFNWLIKTVNLTLTHGQERGSATGQFISLLDIFGFEKFENNSFEQLLINYCNEKLQYHFNSHIFVMEQEAYKLEGVDVSCVTFQDNSATLATIEKKITGLLSMLDEEINVPKGSDLSLLSKIFTVHNKNACVSRAKPSSRAKSQGDTQDSKYLQCFVIKHYAGEVAYEITGFLEKNKDALPHDLMYIGKTSSVPFVAALFQDFEKSMTPNNEPTDVERSSKPRPVVRTTTKPKGPTISAQFKKQLSQLIETLNSTSPYFVRCMKTNPQKEGGVFDSVLMHKQLQYSGLLEVCRIRQDGYPCRIDFQAFHSMYWKLNSSSVSGPSLAQDLEAKGLYGPKDYCIGKSKIFFKYEIGQKLEHMRGDSIHGAANALQGVAKVFLAKRRLKNVLKVYSRLKAAIKSRDREALIFAVDLGKKFLPSEGLHIVEVSEAKATLERMSEEDVVVDMLRKALETKDFSAMEAAVTAARSMKPMLSSPLLRTCENAIKDYLRGNGEEEKIEPPEVSNESTTQEDLPPPPTTTSTFTDVSFSDKVKTGSCSKKMSFSERLPAKKEITFENELQGLRIDKSHHGGLWGSPSVIRAAQGSANASQSNSKFTFPSSSQNSEGVSALKKRFENSPPRSQREQKHDIQKIESSIPPPPPSQLLAKDDCSSLQRKSEEGSTVDEDQIVDPNVDYKSKRKTLLNRQLSTDVISVASEVSHLIEDLSTLCASEMGITVNDIRPLEVMLKKIAVRDDNECKDMVKEMMGEEELTRAKKQLQLQSAVDKVKSTTPGWKLKNFAHQSRQIGMDNYHGMQRVFELLENK